MAQITKRNGSIYLIALTLSFLLLVGITAIDSSADRDMSQNTTQSSASELRNRPQLEANNLSTRTTTSEEHTVTYTPVDLDDESLHWENLYEADWTTDEERQREIDTQWELAAEWGYTKPTEGQALLDTLLASGVVTGSDIPRELSEVEEILPPRHDGEIAILVGSAGVTSLQQDDAGNWIYSPVVSDVGHVVNGSVTQGNILFSGSQNFYQVNENNKNKIDDLFTGGAVFDSDNHPTSNQLYLATNQGVYQGDGTTWGLISETNIFGWSLSSAADGSLWVGGEKMITPPPAITTDSETGQMLVAGRPTTSEQRLTAVTHGMVWRFMDGVWSEIAEFPAEPMIREITVGEVDGQEPNLRPRASCPLPLAAIWVLGNDSRRAGFIPLGGSKHPLYRHRGFPFIGNSK